MGSILQIGAIGQVIYYARMLDKGKTFDILGYNIEPRSAGFFFFSMAVLLAFLLFSSLLLYHSRSKIIKLSCLYEIFCSKKVFSIVGRLQGIFAPGLLSLYDSKTLLKLAGRDARTCGRILRMLISLIQPTITFIIALGALFYIDVLLTVIVLLVTGASMFFHYRNNVRGASSSNKMEKHAPGAQKERRRISNAVTTTNYGEEDFCNWVDSHYDEGEIKDNLEGFRGRFQTLENARLINDLLVAMSLFMVAVILGGKAIMQNAHWGSLIVYLLALRYCLNHLNRMVVTFTSINRFYPMFSRYFYFVNCFDLAEPQKEVLPRRYKIRFESSAFEGCVTSGIIKNGDILAVLGPFEFNFYNIPTYIKCLLKHEEVPVEKILRSMNVVAKTDGYLQPLSLREVFSFPSGYDMETLQRDLRDCGISEEMMSHLPGDLDRPIPREKWDAIELDIRYSLGLLSAIGSSHQWVVIDERVLEHLSRMTRDHLFRRLGEKIILIVFDGELDDIGTYGERIVAIIDGRNLIGLGDVPWFETHKKDIQEMMDFAKKHRTSIQRKGKDEEEDDELDDDI